jgi:glycogen debranching enzyme
MSERAVQVLEGSTFVIGDDHGDVTDDTDREHGFYSDDTRFISRWQLRVGARPLRLLGVDQSSHFDARFFLTAAVGPHDQAPYSLTRSRLLDAVWTETLSIVNHDRTASSIQLVFDVAADFADLFEVKDGVVASRDVRRTEHDGILRFSYDRGEYHRAIDVASTPAAVPTPTGFAYDLVLEPGAEWSASFTFTPESAQPGAVFKRRTAGVGGLAAQRVGKRQELDAWVSQAPTLVATDPALGRTYRASITDLAALRIHPDINAADTFPAAGLPWFMALFGRDSLLTSYQALPYLPALAATTLRVLAGRQAAVRDDFQEQEPGKILHELRFGELTATGRRPHSPYFGSADATPLFLVLLDEYHRWTGDEALVRELEPQARAALRWIAESGDADGDGYVEYERRNHETGLRNQCWKDSWDSMQFADGTLAEGPLAPCEIQGYAYDAQRRAARLARDVWMDSTLGDTLDARAATLRAQFRDDYWIVERAHHALALDGHKRQVDGLTSNIGHLLWSGILDDDQAAATAALLVGDDLQSGWGVRTLGARERGYNPLGYHTGTVWPHDNAFIVDGLVRYGFHEEAVTIGAALLEAAPHFEYRLPEVFAGYPRSATGVPVAFPTASRPQAWAAGAPLLILTALSGLQPGSDELSCDLPDGLGHIHLIRKAP